VGVNEAQLPYSGVPNSVAVDLMFTAYYDLLTEPRGSKCSAPNEKYGVQMSAEIQPGAYHLTAKSLRYSLYSHNSSPLP
jgi:hypothetical protein